VGGAGVLGVAAAGVGFRGVTLAGSGFGVGFGVGRDPGCSPGLSTTAGRRDGSGVRDWRRLAGDLGIAVAFFVGSVFGTATLDGVAVAATGAGGVMSLGDCDPAATDRDGGCGEVAPEPWAPAVGGFGGAVAVGAAAARC
jgi:hypothetical protein